MLREKHAHTHCANCVCLHFVVACYATLHPITPSVSRSVDPSVRHTLFFRRLWGFMLCSAPLCYARFTCSLHAPFTSYLTHFAHFLVGTVEIHRYVFTLKMHFTESLEILVDNRNAQYMISFEPKTAQKRRRIDIWADGQANEWTNWPMDWQEVGYRVTCPLFECKGP